MGSKCHRGALCRPCPGSWPLAFLRHLQALGPGWGWDVLIPPCWYTEQKDAIWFQLRGQGAGVDVRQETPFSYLLRMCSFIRQLSNLASPDGCLWCQGKSTGLWDQMNMILNLDPVPDFATVEKELNLSPLLWKNNEGIISIEQGHYEEYIRQNI